MGKDIDIDINDQNNKCLNVTLAIITSLVLILTAFEIIMPIVIFVMSLLVSVKMKNSIIFEDSQKILAVVNLIVAIVSLVLIFIYFLQYFFTFKKGVQIARHIVNVVFTAVGIWALVVSRKSAENDFMDNLTKEWNSTSERTNKFEEKNKCKGLEMLKTTTEVLCDEPLQKEFDSVYNLTRRLAVPFGLFWAAIIIYSTISIVILCFDKE